MSNRSGVLLFVVSSAILSSELKRAERNGADVIVYGATASGVMAAITVAREGKSVILLEPGKHTGGMVSGGLGATDAGNREAIGGYPREFFRRVRQYYVKTYGEKSDQVKDCSDGFHFEPHLAEEILTTMIKEAKVEVRFGQRLSQVRKTSTHIDSLTTTKGDSFAAVVFIDASYEGDLMASAGVNYTIGR